MSSRSGEPSWSSVTSSPSPPSWSKSVSWHKADILKPSTYQPLLKDADAVVHSMGILLEADYKGVLQGKESVYRGLQRAFSNTKGGSQNPLERKQGEDLKPQEKDGQLTYELMNRDSGMAAIFLDAWNVVMLTSKFKPSLSPKNPPRRRSPPSSTSPPPEEPPSYHSATSPQSETRNLPSQPPFRPCAASSSDQAFCTTPPAHSPCPSQPLVSPAPSSTP